jgi:transposase
MTSSTALPEGTMKWKTMKWNETPRNPDPSGETPAHWTLEALAAAAKAEGIRVGRSQVRRILLSERVRWRQTRSWAQSTDPDFAPKGPRSSPATQIRPRKPR